MIKEGKHPRLELALAMLVFGTIGIFRKFIPLSSSVLAMVRGFIGSGFLLLFVVLGKKQLDRQALRQNGKLLVLSGIFIGLNWILLFEAYRYTSVAVATLCYYMAPVMVVLASPLLLKERLSGKKLACVGLTVLGMVFVSGVMEESGGGSLKGVALGLGAAFLYACVVLINKKLPALEPCGKTMIQLFSAAAVLLPYNLLVPGPSAAVSGPVALLVAVVGIVHTGIAYALYFGAIGSLKAQTAAIYSYIDPVTAILLSLLVFREEMTVLGLLGAVLILGATLASDLIDK